MTFGKVMGGGLPGGGVRRPRRRDVAARAGGAGLPGRHPVREPDRHHRRAGHPAAGDRRRLRPPDRGRRHLSAAARRRAHRGRRAPRHPVGRARCSRCSSPTARSRDFADASRTDVAAYAAFFHAMLEPRGLPAAVGVRGVVPVRRPRRPRRADRARRPARPPPRAAARSTSETLDEPRLGPPTRSSTCCATARCTTPSGVLYGRRDGFHLSDLGRQMAEKVADLARGPRHRRTCGPRRSSGPRRRPRRSPTGSRLEIGIDERVIESTNGSRA